MRFSRILCSIDEGVMPCCLVVQADHMMHCRERSAKGCDACIARFAAHAIVRLGGVQADHMMHCRARSTR